MALRPFRNIPKDTAEWARWMRAQDLASSDHSHSGSSSSSVALPTTKIWSFGSPSGGTGTFYFAGDYDFHSTSFTPAGGTAVGTANSSYAAHAMVILGATSANMAVTVAGTSITDDGIRTGSDTETISCIGAANDYFETNKKWIGQVTYSLASGTGVVINAGFAKYWDNQNTDFTVTGCEATWYAGANDSGANIEIIHHKPTGWTYGAGGAATPPTAIAGMNADHVTEKNLVNGKPGAWKRTNLDTDVQGAGSEGIIWRVTTGANKAFELGNLELRVVQTV